MKLDSKRALRRHHARRLKRARRYRWFTILNEKQLGKVLHTSTPCSCWMCGNPRKFEGSLTVQERRYLLGVKADDMEQIA